MEEWKKTPKCEGCECLKTAVLEAVEVDDNGIETCIGTKPLWQQCFHFTEVGEMMDDTKARINIVTLVVHSGCAKTNSEARRLVDQKAVEVNGRKILCYNALVVVKTGYVLKVGKRTFRRLVIPEDKNA